MANPRGARKSSSRARKRLIEVRAPEPAEASGERPSAHPPPRKRARTPPAATRAAALPAKRKKPARTPVAPVAPAARAKAAKKAKKAAAPAPPPSPPRKRAKVTARSPKAASVPVREPRAIAAAVQARGPSAGEGAARSGDRLPAAGGRVMELHWEDDAPPPPRNEGLVQRWVKRGDALLRHLAEHGAARHEYRADLKEGRFVWLHPDGHVSAEARAQVICSYAQSTSVLSMAWTDPLVKSAGVARIDGMSSEIDALDEEGAWRVAMEAAEIARAEYLYRVTTPHAWYFLALRGLSFAPERASFTPGTPVGLVLRSLVETRQAIESRAEPTEVVRARLLGVGRALLQEAGYAYRGTDWVARLERTGKWMLLLAERLPRTSFSSVAAGRCAEEWLDRDATIDLSQALTLLEDEWALFA
jgi:hypothetical protein